MFRMLLGAAGFGLTALTLTAELPSRSADLFRLDQIWSAHLTFTADQWTALQPDEPESGFPFGPGPGGPPGGRGGFGLGTLFAGPLLTKLDRDADGAVTQTEFVEGFGVWFQSWEGGRQGFLTTNEIRKGLNQDLTPQFGPPPGGGRGPGGPPGMNLQGRPGGRNGLSALRGIEFDYVRADLRFEEVRLPNVAVRYKGNGTFMDARSSDKKSFKVDLNDFVKGQKVGGVSKLNFHNNVTDGGFMNEPLGYWLYREAGVPAPRTSYSRLSIEAGGAHTNRYLGLYSIVENPDNNWAEDRFGTKKGLILKPVTRELFKFQGQDWSQYQQAYDPKTDPTATQLQRVYDFARLVTEARDEEFAQRLPEFLDIDEFSRFMAVTVWLSSTDSILMMGQNFVVYLHPKSDRFLFVPWDLDRAFGNFFTPSPTEMSIRAAWAADNRFLQRVMKVDAVKQAYLARMTEFQDSIFRPEHILAQVDQLAAVLRPAVKEEGQEALDRFDQVVAGQTPRQRGFGFQTGQTLRAFVTARHQSVADQLAGKSEGVELGWGFGRRGGPGPRGGGGPGGPGGLGGPGGAPPGPGDLWTTVWVKEADQDADGKVTAAEFTRLAEAWFKKWDTENTGSLKQADLSAGLNGLLPPPTFPPGRE